MQHVANGWLGNAVGCNESAWKTLPPAQETDPGFPVATASWERCRTSIGGGAGRPPLAWPLPTPELNNNAAVPTSGLDQVPSIHQQVPMGRLSPETTKARDLQKRSTLSLFARRHFARTARDNNTPIRLQFHDNSFLAGRRPRRRPSAARSEDSTQCAVFHGASFL